MRVYHVIIEKEEHCSEYLTPKQIKEAIEEKHYNLYVEVTE